MTTLFMGEYNHSIDTKGRIIVPSKFRELLGERFVVTRGLDGCLWVLPTDEWDDFTGKLRSLPVANKDARKIVRLFMSGAMDAELDKQGRILLPQNLREYAKLEKDITMVGTGARIEIWDKKAWEESSTYDNVDDIAEHLGEWGFGI